MAATTLNPELTELSLERLQRRRSAKWAHYPEDVLPAWVAEMDFPLAAPIRGALEETIGLDDCGYAWPEALGLAEAFAGFARERWGWEVDTAQVSPANDVVSAITALLRKLTEPGDKVVVDPPVYHPFFAIIEELGCELAEAPLAGGELDLDAIERQFAAGAKALILCSPHNPAGSVPTREQLEAVAAIAERHGAWVLADEIHSPLTLPGATHVPYLTVSAAAAERGFALCSASKAFNFAGLHCAQFVTASASAREVVEGLPFSATHCGHLGAIATVAAYRESGAWLDDVRAVIDHNRALLSELVAEKLPLAGYRPQRAGYLSWLDLRGYDLGDDPSEQLLAKGKIAVNAGPTFGPQGAGFVRLNIGTSPALVEEAVTRIAAGVAGG
jgi:cystathionine beta-lyase